MNQLDTAHRRLIVACLVEGVPIRGVCRITGTSKGTVLRLVRVLGAACRALHDDRVRDLSVRLLQADEIWGYIHTREKRDQPRSTVPGRGDAWTWTAIDHDSRLLVAFVVGKRTTQYARLLMRDIASRLRAGLRLQLTTDGLRAYELAVESTFGWDGVDYGQLVKKYGPSKKKKGKKKKSGRLVCVGVKRASVMGQPDLRYTSTSYVERQNRTMRETMRRLTRRTTGASKQQTYFAHDLAIHVAYYNWCRVHMTLRVTPAMAAGLTDHVWSIDELLALIPAPPVAPWGSRNRA